MQIVAFVLDVGAGRTHADQYRILELEIGDDVFHDAAGADRPLFGMLVVGVEMPVFERIEAGPEAHLVVPGRILWMDPPCQVKEAWQRHEMVSHVGKDDLEFLVVVEAREANALHALINGHRSLRMLNRSDTPPHPPGTAGVRPARFAW